MGKDGIVAKGIKQNNNIYRMLFVTRIECQANFSAMNDLKTWHERLGHVNVKLIINSVETGLVKGVNLS